MPPRKPQAVGESALDVLESYESAVQGILIHRHFKPLYVNPAFARMMGYATPAELLAVPLLRPLVPPENWPRIEDQHHAFLRGEVPPRTFRERFVSRGGRECWGMGARRVVTWQGQPAVQVDMFDITDQMQAETQLLDSEQRLSAILAMMPLPLLITSSATGRVLQVNRKACLLLSASANQLMRGTLEPFVSDISELARLRALIETSPEVREFDLPMLSARGIAFPGEVAAIRIDYGGEPSILYAFNDVSERKRAEKLLKMQALTDELTGISNRRHFFVVAEQEATRSQRYQRPLSLFTFDIDHFKQVNDSHGHAAGDAVIQGIVALAQDQLRATDLLARVGGEEFVALLPETDIEGAMLTAERLRVAVAAASIPTVKGSLQTTISIGVAQLTQTETLDALLSRADTALYRAKNAGRNRTEQAV